MARNMRPLEVFPITTRTLDVVRVAHVTPGMIRVTLSGAQLAAHTAANGFPVAAFRSDGFDDEFKLILKHPDVEVAVGPTQDDGQLNWPRGDEHLVSRTYTVRRWDVQAQELDIDVVVHGLGPATRWARTVQPGEQIQIAGPKMSAGHPEGADWVLIAGDETALPAIARWLDEWPDGVRAQVFIEIADDTHRQELAERAGVDVTWLSRDGAEAGTGSLLFDALQAAPWWEGAPFAWVAGESLTLTPIRRWLRNDRGLEKHQIDVTGYWRRQEVVVREDDASMIDLEATHDEEEALHHLGEIVPGFALRVAGTIGLAPAFDGAPQTLAVLAERTSTAPTALAKVLRYLGSLGVVEKPTPDSYALTGMGRALENDHLAEHFDLGGYVAQRELAAMLNLLEVVRGQEAHIALPGSATDTNSAVIDERLSQAAHDGRYVAGPVADALTIPADARVLITGVDAPGLAEAIVRRQPDLHIDIVAAPSEISLFATMYAADDRVSYVPGSLLHAQERIYDVALLAEAVKSATDDDAVHMIAMAVASTKPGGRLVIFSETLDTELADDEDYAEDLILLGSTGGGLRTHDEHVSLFAAAGVNGAERVTIGWGYTLYVALVEGQATS